MKTFQAMELFAAQLMRHIESALSKTKVVVTPSSIKERGLIIQVSLLKTYIESKVKGYTSTRSVKLQVAVRGTVESMTGLEMAVDAIEQLDMYLSKTPIHLEWKNGTAIPDTRIVTTIDPDDSFIDSPESTEVQDVEDIRTCMLTIPTADIPEPEPEAEPEPEEQ